jgi:hypothetical protein
MVIDHQLTILLRVINNTAPRSPQTMNLLHREVMVRWRDWYEKEVVEQPSIVTHDPHDRQLS